MGESWCTGYYVSMSRSIQAWDSDTCKMDKNSRFTSRFQGMQVVEHLEGMNWVWNQFAWNGGKPFLHVEHRASVSIWILVAWNLMPWQDWVWKNWRSHASGCPEGHWTWGAACNTKAWRTNRTVARCDKDRPWMAHGPEHTGYLRHSKTSWEKHRLEGEVFCLIYRSKHSCNRLNIRIATRCDMSTTRAVYINVNCTYMAYIKRIYIIIYIHT